MKTSYSLPPFQRRSSHSALVVLFSFVAAVVVLAMAGGIVQAGGPPPVVVDSIEPAEIVQGQVPQPELTIFGSNFIEGFPNETNRPTVTLRQPGKGGAEYSVLAFVNFAGTVATVPRDLINLLQAPLGVYDVIVTRPTDNASGTLEGAFTVTDGEPGPGEIALLVRSAWGGPVNDVEVVGNLAYAAIGRRLVILDVSDATNPVEVGSLNIMPGVEGVAVRDGYAFLGAHKPYRFTVVDVSDPTNPTLVWAGQGDNFSHDVQLYGNLAYVRETGGSVQAFDITSPSDVVYLGGVSIGGRAGATMIVGDLLYIGTDQLSVGGSSLVAFRLYDLAADPLNPPMIGEVQFNASDPKNNPYGGGFTRAVAVEGDYAVWTLHKEDESIIGTEMLLVVDVSDPQLPVIVGSYDNDVTIGHRLGDVALSGGYAYVTDVATGPGGGNGPPTNWASAEGLIVFDIATNPTNPTIVSTFKTHGNVTGVEIVGNRAYLHDRGEGLIILDITDPAKPVRLGNYYSPATLRQMVKDGDLLFVSDAWNGFTVLDVSDASHPQVVGVYLADHYNDLGVNALGLVLRDNLVYLGAGHLGLEVVDVSDPANPTFLAAFRIPPPGSPCSRFAGLALSGDIAHIGFNETFCGVIGPDWFLNLDVTDPQGIVELGRIQVGVRWPPRTIEIDDDRSIAFVTRDDGIGSDNLTDLTIDIFDPESPTVMYDGQIPAVADVALDVDRKILYLASNENTGGETEPGLYIQDVTDPANPVLLAHVDESVAIGAGVSLNLVYAVTKQGERLYLIGRGGWGRQTAYVFDTVIPGSPVLLDFLPYVGGTKSSVLVDEPYLYLTNEFEGLNDPGIGLVVIKVVGLNPVGDLDGDGSVGVKDLLILLGSWGPCADCKLPGDCPADLDDDCSVGVKDLLILLGNWG